MSTTFESDVSERVEAILQDAERRADAYRFGLVNSGFLGVEVRRVVNEIRGVIAEPTPDEPGAPTSELGTGVVPVDEDGTVHFIQ